MPSKRKLTNNNSPKKTRKSARKSNRTTNTTTQTRQDVAAGAFANYDATNLPSLHMLREECKRLLMLVKTTRNANVIDHFLACLLLQMNFKVLLAIWAGLCPTPKERGHESLGGAGRIDLTRGEGGEAATIRFMRVLDEVLPGPEDGGIESGGILSRSWWINAREICTNDGETCFRCKEYAKEEARDIGNALVIISKFIRLIGGKIVVMCAAGLSVKAERLFDILKKEGEFDGLSDYGTHGSFLGAKCLAWDKDEQCTVNEIALHGHDNALRSSFESIGYTPSRTMLKTAQMSVDLRYVPARESDLTDKELAELRQARDVKALEALARKAEEMESRQSAKAARMAAQRAADEEAEKVRNYANDCRRWFVDQGYTQREVIAEPGKLGIGLGNCKDYLRVKSIDDESQLKDKVSENDIIMSINDVDVIHLPHEDALQTILSAVENSKNFEIWTECRSLL